MFCPDPDSPLFVLRNLRNHCSSLLLIYLYSLLLHKIGNESKTFKKIQVQVDILSQTLTSFENQLVGCKMALPFLSVFEFNTSGLVFGRFAYQAIESHKKIAEKAIEFHCPYKIGLYI